MKDKLKILFLCTGNSCRSQMAELIDNFSKNYSDSHKEANCPLSNTKHGKLLWMEENWLSNPSVRIDYA